MANEPRPRRDDLRERLVLAATDVIAREGHFALRARDLAKAAGCALGAIYGAFPDLDALVNEVKRRAIDSLALRSNVVADEILSGLERAGASAEERSEAAERGLQALSALYLGFALENRNLWRTMFEHRIGFGESLEAYLARLSSVFINVERLAKVVAPNLEPDEAAPLARVLFAGAHGVIALALGEKLGPTETQALTWQVRQIVGLAVTGLKVRGASVPAD